MTLVLGLALILLAVVLAVVQVPWAARSGDGTVRRWHVSEPLPRSQRYASDVAIAALLLGGAIVVERGRPWWVFYAVAIGGVLVTAAAQALAVEARAEPVEH